MPASGYGQSYDRTRAVMLARRRWVLVLRRGFDWDEDELWRHLELWKDWGLHYERLTVINALHARAENDQRRDPHRLGTSRDLLTALAKPLR
jgi:hypothetical protein